MAAPSTTYVRRRTAAAAADVQLKELGLRFFSTLVRNVDYDDPAVLEGPLKSVSDVLGAMAPLHLFPDWSPPRESPESDVPIKPTDAFASSVGDTSSKGAGKAVEKSGYWSANSGEADTHWGVKLDEAVDVSSVWVEWQHAPEEFTIQVKAEADGDWVTVDEVKGTRVVDDRRFRVDTVKARQVRLKMKGFAKDNKDRTHSISKFRINTPDLSGVHVPTKKSLDDLQMWMSRTITSAPSSVHSPALRGLAGMTLASGSLTSLLQMAQLLLSRDPAPVPADASEATARFVAQLERVAGAERAVQAKQDAAAVGGGGGGGGGFGEVKGVTFDTGASASVSFENGNMTVSSTGTGYCALTYGPITKGKAAWEMRLDQDTSSQCSCFGAIKKPVTNTNYEYSPDMWMYRAYNGRHYQNGSTVGGSTKRVFQGDLVRMEVDMDEGTMKYFVNGEDQGVAFTNLKGKEIWPACAFYSSSRKVTLVKFEADGGGGGSSVGTAAPVVNLVDLTEMSVSGLDKGVLGKGDQMGFDGLKLKVGGKPVNSGLGMVPPRNEVPDDAKEGEVVEEPRARVTYALNKKYETFKATVGINDTASDEKIASEGSPLTFEVVGDGEVLWRSKPLSKKEETEEVEVGVLEVRELTLRVGVESANADAHAVWVDPRVEECTDWTCNGWVNDKDTFTCALWGSKRGQTTPLPPVKADSGTTHGLAHAALVYGGLLANEYMRGMRVAPEPVEGVSSVDLESPFAIEASGDTFARLTSLLGDIAFKSGPLFEAAAVGLVRIIKANLRRLIVSRVSPAAAELGGATKGASESKDGGAEGDSKEGEGDPFKALKPLHTLLQKIIESTEAAPAVRGEAVDAEEAGRDLFVPSVEERRELVKSQLSEAGVVELQLQWPIGASNEDGDPIDLEKLVLLLQLYCNHKKWRHTLVGRWPSKIYLVMEVSAKGPAEEKVTLEHFLGDDLGSAFAKAGEPKWSFPDGLSSPELPVKVERVPTWDRRARLPMEPGIGAVRVYPESSGTYEDVVGALKAFLPKRHLVGETQ